MKDEDFNDLMTSLSQALAFARGEQVPGMRVHHIPVIDVAAIRKKSGTTPDEVTRQIGVSTSTVQNWEQGRR